MPKGYEILNGAIDLHVHAGPDLYHRPLDEIDIARQAKEIGYKALLFKSHFTTNADRLYVIGKMLDGVSVFGNLTLNLSVGGINPHAVFAAIQLGAKEIKMPTVHAANHIKIVGKATYSHFEEKFPPKLLEIKGISILVGEKELIPELYDVLHIIAKNKVILSTGHLSKPEIISLVKAANDVNVEKIVITHAEAHETNLSVEEQEELAEMGAYIEHTFAPCMPYNPSAVSPKQIASNISRVGADRCVMSTDFGQFINPFPIEGMRMFVHNMLRQGISEKEIDIMIKRNPARLLDIDQSI